MAFAKLHLPCGVCGGSDPVSVNEDGSGFCFSCYRYFRNYEESMEGQVTNLKSYKELDKDFKSYYAIKH